LGHDATVRSGDSKLDIDLSQTDDESMDHISLHGQLGQIRRRGLTVREPGSTTHGVREGSDESLERPAVLEKVRLAPHDFVEDLLIQHAFACGSEP
jgi:hypothetical protein